MSRSETVARPPMSVPNSAPARIDAAGCTHPGAIRQSNEDNFLVAELMGRGAGVRETSAADVAGRGEGGDAHRMLVVVADGVAGRPGGAEASASAVRQLARDLISALSTSESKPHRSLLVRQKLVDSVAHADAALRHDDVDPSEAKTPAEGTWPAPDILTNAPATTLTAAVLDWPNLHVAHVGDSRCYLYRKNELSRLTNDHTLAEAVRSIAGEANGSFAHVLTNVVGGEGVAVPDLRSLRIARGDVLLLCTDGVLRALTEARIGEILAEPLDAWHLSRRILSEALAEESDDNITAVVSKIV